MEQQKGIVEIVSEKVWKFFSSVKLAVVLLIILAIVSVIGTVIQQNEPPEKYLQEYSAATVQLFEAIGFFDMYHTWWFVLLLFLLTANLTICTLDRFPRTWSIITARLKPIDDEGLKAVPFKKEIIFKGGMDKAEARASQALQAAGYRYLVSGGPGVHHLYSQKGAYSRLGVYITHTSIILIFVGALIGTFFGFKGFLNLAEGEPSNKVFLRNEPMWDKITAAFGIGEQKVIRDPRVGVPSMPLGFIIRCDNFEVDYYQNQGIPTGMPKEYYSILSVFDLEGRPIIDQRRIVVNDPLTHRGITFYQSSYGMIPGASGKIVLTVRPKNEASPGELVVLDPGASTYVRSIDRTIKAVGMAPFGYRDPATGQVRFLRSEELINPTVELEVYKGKSLLYKTYVMKADSGEPAMPENYTIRYDDYWGARYTGLQVTKDPGVWVVYTGFILLCIGPLIAFFGSHKKIWVRILDRKGHASITVAGSANRNRLGFEREFNRIAEKIAK
ncbi:MAG: cytochrome c biogenesis protein ResB [Nitrospirota bacterium]